MGLEPIRMLAAGLKGRFERLSHGSQPLDMEEVISCLDSILERLDAADEDVDGMLHHLHQKNERLEQSLATHIDLLKTRSLECSQYRERAEAAEKAMGERQTDLPKGLRHIELRLNAQAESLLDCRAFLENLQQRLEKLEEVESPA